MSYAKYLYIGVIVLLVKLVLIIFFVLRSKRRARPCPEKGRILAKCSGYKPKIKQYLYFKGDDELEKKMLGLITGIYREKKDIYIAFKDRTVDVFKGTMDDLKTKDLDAQIIELDGMSFYPMIDGMMQLAKNFSKKEKVLGCTKDEYAYNFEEAQDDIVQLSQKAINASPHHQKEMERQNMFADQSSEKKMELGGILDGKD